ncbi:MAG: hypothetical protein IKJ97_07765 [Bacteroidaceae bacterium]|nr:hypothetical protein [Bacteroidaceae bacterium]
MKKYILLLLCFMQSMLSFAQDCVLPVSVRLDEDFADVPKSACNVLLNSLNRIALENNLTTEAPSSPFILTARCDVLEKSNLPGPPIQTVYNLGLTLYILDTYNQKKFSSTYIATNGVGKGEVKSYINAFKKINANSEEIKDFISVAKSKMLNYYDTQYQNIIKEAKKLASLQRYEEALAMVLAIPVCSKGGDEAQSYGYALYEEHLDRMNLFLLNRAKALWSANQTQQVALDVCGMLANIDPYAACYDDAAKLMAEVKGQVREDIDFEMRQKYNDSLQLERDRIKAAMAVGVAFGNNQQTQTTNLMWLK